jgi:hypothetical protein
MALPHDWPADPPNPHGPGTAPPRSAAAPDPRIKLIQVHMPSEHEQPGGDQLFAASLLA